MTARAYVETDWLRRGVRVWLGDEDVGGTTTVDFTNVAKRRNADQTVTPEASPLALTNEQARALYSALGDHFGHSGTDTRALRKDYDAERARVDLFIASLTRSDQ